MTLVTASQIRRENLGIWVPRATANLPQSGQSALFTITGGLVAVTQIVGVVTTIIQTQANNTKLVGNPTTGTDVDLCAVTSITADEVGTLYGISGLQTDALIALNAGGLPAQTRWVILNTGTLDLSCAASNSGQVRWGLTYIPLDDGARVTAA